MKRAHRTERCLQVGKRGRPLCITHGPGYYGELTGWGGDPTDSDLEAFLAALCTSDGTLGWL